MTSVRTKLLVLLALTALMSGAAATGAFAREQYVVSDASDWQTAPLKDGPLGQFSGEPDTPHGSPQQSSSSGASAMIRVNRDESLTTGLIERWRWAMRLWLSRFQGPGI